MDRNPFQANSPPKGTFHDKDGKRTGAKGDASEQ
jgi:hypothetical protein